MTSSRTITLQADELDAASKAIVYAVDPLQVAEWLEGEDPEAFQNELAEDYDKTADRCRERFRQLPTIRALMKVNAEAVEPLFLRVWEELTGDPQS